MSARGCGGLVQGDAVTRPDRVPVRLRRSAGYQGRRCGYGCTSWWCGGPAGVGLRGNWVPEPGALEEGGGAELAG